MEMRKYEEWQACAMDETKRKVLKTVDKILEDAGTEMSLNDLERLNYCWDIIRDMAHIRSAEHPPEKAGGAAAPEMTRI